VARPQPAIASLWARRRLPAPDGQFAHDGPPPAGSFHGSRVRPCAPPRSRSVDIRPRPAFVDALRTAPATDPERPSGGRYHAGVDDSRRSPATRSPARHTQRTRLGVSGVSLLVAACRRCSGYQRRRSRARPKARPARNPRRPSLTGGDPCARSKPFGGGREPRRLRRRRDRFWSLPGTNALVARGRWAYRANTRLLAPDSGDPNNLSRICTLRSRPADCGGSTTTWSTDRHGPLPLLRRGGWALRSKPETLRVSGCRARVRESVTLPLVRPRPAMVRREDACPGE
jgi:hypothetical protein